MIAGFVNFEFDLPEALLSSIIDVFTAVEAAPLTPEFVRELPDEQGVYQLFLDGQLTYIGKTDADAGLRKRLSKHSRKILHRRSLDPASVSFKAVRVYVFTAIDLESQLIKHYGGVGAVKWNGSGFGSNDPGRERDTTKYKPEHYDALFPVDIDIPLELMLPETGTAAFILNALRQHIPYGFRVEGSAAKGRKTHPDIEQSEVKIDLASPLTACSVIAQTVSQLPASWQATLLPSYIILYKENKAYPSGLVIQRSAQMITD